MPSLQQLGANGGAANVGSFSEASTEILQTHSINSILEQRQDLLNQQNETTGRILSPINDLFKLNFYGLKNAHDFPLASNGDAMSSSMPPYTPLTPSSTQSLLSPAHTSSNSLDVFQFENVAQNTPIKAFQKNVSFDYSAPLSPSTPTSNFNRSFHNSPLISDSSNSSSGYGISLDSIPMIYQNTYNGSGPSWSRSNSPESQNSNQSNAEQKLMEAAMNVLSINNTESENQGNLMKLQNSPSTPPANLFDEKNLPHYETLSAIDFELSKLQTLNTLKMLQAQTQRFPFLNNLLQGYNTVNHQFKNIQMPQSAVGSINDAHLDRIAKLYRCSASYYEATCTWSGQLPQRSHRMLNYSPKVFLGGIPWDISEQSLIQIFKPFGQIKVEWPGKEQQAAQPKGFVYIIFESEKQVKALLAACVFQSDDSLNTVTYYFKISSRRIKSKDVEVIPWIIADSNFVKNTSQKLDPTKTVFVGALHGKLTAEGLAKIMDELFDGVLYAGIDTDKYKYPIGSGRVTFSNNRSYMKAVMAAFVDIRSAKFTKKVQIDPYLEDALCSVCGVQHGPYYCRELSCFRYFCRTCWQWQHTMEGAESHKPLTRNSKSQTLVGIGPSTSTSLCSYNTTIPQQQQQQQKQSNLLNQDQNIFYQNQIDYSKTDTK
ncbi:cytoplasmic polyadenylation element-binding protein [Teleopsis dalmanni]|uniref:cytoplasmic polyadenylation element-binding protein n=1 Tax=Teleopsis dalmanni TaxID=139649 RepID=UPI0018CD61BC|nr:cytoplasmic polyadenylation element-binding protein [Teleopsis dalmanni]